MLEEQGGLVTPTRKLERHRFATLPRHGEREVRSSADSFGIHLVLALRPWETPPLITAHERVANLATAHSRATVIMGAEAIARS